MFARFAATVIVLLTVSAPAMAAAAQRGPDFPRPVATGDAISTVHHFRQHQRAG